MSRLLLYTRSLLTLLVALLMVGSSHAQSNNAYESYIRQYRHMAIEQMYKYGVPASITLAQGLLESRAGQSELATRANNHFGIKVGGTWTGPYILRDDDARNEKFRVYRNAAESYEDHSRFLARGQRYASLFSLERDDYRGWARGLKQAGYATNPRYADLLISLIERYDLQRYDKMSREGLADHVSNERAADRNTLSNDRRVYRCNDAYYVVAHSGDTYATIARWAGISERRLRKYNEVPKKASLEQGDIVYLQKKRSKAARQLRKHYHTVGVGESLHSISQRYGMRLQTLTKVNHLQPDHTLQVGERLRIR